MIQKSYTVFDPVFQLLFEARSMFMQCSSLVNVISAKVGSLETSFLLLRYTQASHYNVPKCSLSFQ